MGRKKIITFSNCKECGKKREDRKPNGVRYKRSFCSKSCMSTALGRVRVPYVRTPEIRKKMSEAQKGEKANNWQGGKTAVHEALRKNVEYKLWREAVFSRDNWTCQGCGDRNGNGHEVTLNADHIKPFSLYPDLRFAIDNGQTLCVPCHKETPTYGWKIHNSSGRYKQFLGKTL